MRSNVGADYSPDGAGWGPVYYVSRYAFTTAYLATANFASQDSISARITQARYTGMFRFSCKAFMAWSNQHMAAGSSAPASARRDNPADFAGRYDRNHLAYAAIIFGESLAKETGEAVEYSAHRFWEDNCVAPNAAKNAVPTATWRADPSVYGHMDAFGHQVDPIDIGPLLAFGSLRQLRDTVTGGAGYAEDFTEASGVEQFGKDRSERFSRSFQNMYEQTICSPEYAVSLEDLVGDPPFPEESIKDASSRMRKTFDMEVPPELVGATAFDRVVSAGCGPDDCGDGGHTWRSVNMYQWVYVTSSDDPAVSAGWHRALDVKAWPTRKCYENANQVCKTVDATPRSVQFPTIPANPVDALLSGLSSAGLWVAEPVQTVGEALDDFGEDVSEGLEDAVDGAREFWDANFAPDGAIGGLFGRRAEEATPSASRSSSPELRAMRRRLFVSPAKVIARKRLNSGAERSSNSAWRTGAELIADTRCSDYLHSKGVPGAVPCSDGRTRWYRGRGGGCSDGLLSISAGGRAHNQGFYLQRLFGTPPPPSPAPRPPPPTPPSPPVPRNPPLPPAATDAAEVRALVRTVERCAYCLLRSSPHLRGTHAAHHTTPGASAIRSTSSARGAAARAWPPTCSSPSSSATASSPPRSRPFFPAPRPRPRRRRPSPARCRRTSPPRSDSSSRRRSPSRPTTSAAPPPVGARPSATRWRARSPSRSETSSAPGSTAPRWAGGRPARRPSAAPRCPVARAAFRSAASRACAPAEPRTRTPTPRTCSSTCCTRPRPATTSSPSTSTFPPRRSTPSSSSSRLGRPRGTGTASPSSSSTSSACLSAWAASLGRTSRSRTTPSGRASSRYAAWTPSPRTPTTSRAPACASCASSSTASTARSGSTASSSSSAPSAPSRRCPRLRLHPRRPLASAATPAGASRAFASLAARATVSSGRSARPSGSAPVLLPVRHAAGAKRHGVGRVVDEGARRALRPLPERVLRAHARRPGRSGLRPLRQRLLRPLRLLRRRLWRGRLPTERLFTSCALRVGHGRDRRAPGGGDTSSCHLVSTFVQIRYLFRILECSKNAKYTPKLDMCLPAVVALWRKGIDWRARRAALASARSAGCR